MATGSVEMSGAAGARPGFSAVTPYLMAPDIEPVITFAKTVLGAEETMRTRGGAGGVHCELRIGDSMLMCGGGDAVFNPVVAPRLVGLHVYVGDVDAAYGRAIEAGATSLGAPSERPYGERAAFLQDAAGNRWYIATPSGPSASAQPQRALTPHLYVQREDGRGAPAFIAFAEAALGVVTEARHDSPDGLVMHAVLRLQGAAIEVGEGRKPAFRAPAAFYLYVKDCDALYAQAVAAGARGVHPPADQVFGDRMGTIEDPWGNEWFIATHPVEPGSRRRP